MTKLILIVEDDMDDCDLLWETIQSFAPESHVHFAENGLEALEYLYELKHAGKPFPGLIILDLNMPYLSGSETYRKIKEDPTLCQIPIVVYTSSTNPYEKMLFENMEVKFISKPCDFNKMQQQVTQMLAVSVGGQVN